MTAATAPSPPASARGQGGGARRGSHFGPAEWALVEELIALDRSPEQVAGWLARHELLAISSETMYLYVWRDKGAGGGLWRYMRQAGKRGRKRYGAHDSRGRLAGKRHISERPAEVEGRSVIGHWEIDTVKGDDQARHSVVTLVERRTGYLAMGKLARHRAGDATARTIELIGRHEGRVRTVTADNGTEFHSYAEIEDATGALFYFAPRTTPGSAGRTRTRTGSSVSTCPSAGAWRTSRRPTATRSPAR